MRDRGERMRAVMMAALMLALPLGGCGRPALALSDDPVTRAAQCAVTSTVQARLGQADVTAPLPFEAQVRVLHAALLAGSAGDTYDAGVAAAVLKTLPQVEPAISGGRWEMLVPACELAFPDMKARPELPAAVLDAQLGCSLLAQYVARALQSQQSSYADALGTLTRMRAALDDRIAARLADAGQTGAARQRDERARAMRAIVRGGAAKPMLDRCVEKYG